MEPTTSLNQEEVWKFRGYNQMKLQHFSLLENIAKHYVKCSLTRLQSGFSWQLVSELNKELP